MADNVVVTAGTGTTVAADEVVDGTLGTVKVQYVKLMDGTLDSTTKISPATSGKQPALGTAGTASSDVLTVQGIASMTALKVDGSAVTQPVSGTITETNSATILARTPTLGQTTMSASEPVTIASDQTAIAVKGGTTAGSAVNTTPLLSGIKDNAGNLQAALGAPSATTGQAGTLGIPYGAQALYAGTGNYTPLANIATGKAQSSGNIISSAGMVGFDGTNYQVAKMSTSGDLTIGASTTSGYTPGHIVSAASTNAAVIKASAGTLGYMSGFNINASARYVHVYDKATTPTVGTDVPIQTYLIPGNAAGAGFVLPLPPQGLLCAAGISYSITAGMADTDATAIGAADVVLNWGTK